MGLSERVRALVRPEVSGLEPYDPDFVPCRVNLSANECTWPAPAPLAEAVRSAVDATPLNRYPDPMANALRDALAEWHGVERGQVCVGNGGDELIFNLFLAFGGPGRRVLDMPPTFSVYSIYSSLLGCEVASVPRDAQTLEPRWDEALDRARGCQVAVVCSPNNPTGDVAPLSRVEQMCEACPGIVLADEAYGEFSSAPSAARLLADHPNLVVLHTLSKAFGLAGCRVGYVLAAPDVVDAFAAVRQPYTVNVLSQAAAEASVALRGLVLERTEAVVAERARLAARLEGLGLRVWPSEANFVLVRVPFAHEVRRRLAEEHSVLVRDFSATPGLADCLRVTVGTPEEDDVLLDALARTLGV